MSNVVDDSPVAKNPKPDDASNTVTPYEVAISSRWNARSLARPLDTIDSTNRYHRYYLYNPSVMDFTGDQLGKIRDDFLQKWHPKESWDLHPKGLHRVRYGYHVFITCDDPDETSGEIYSHYHWVICSPTSCLVGWGSIDLDQVKWDSWMAVNALLKGKIRIEGEHGDVKLRFDPCINGKHHKVPPFKFDLSTVFVKI